MEEHAAPAGRDEGSGPDQWEAGQWDEDDWSEEDQDLADFAHEQKLERRRVNRRSAWTIIVACAAVNAAFLYTAAADPDMRVGMALCAGIAVGIGVGAFGMLLEPDSWPRHLCLCIGSFALTVMSGLILMAGSITPGTPVVLFIGAGLGVLGFGIAMVVYAREVLPRRRAR